ncbi:hypothetical protein AW736_04935 [Termitidicoccus mucosus]|uniref:Uncharacterized protein n=2 Tax=Termitidicoccus mucosus TaxID=1184151 RepID=A0A178IMJ2_9BACT|nr:hypothetical protein AW736_04935 [Opitutaceae bacterium TSB47]
MTEKTQNMPVWGRLADENRTAIVVRFVLPDRTVSLPYHTLVRWELSIGESETLAIQAAGVLVTVRGRLLAVLRDGLDQARLEQVRAQGERAALRAAPGEPWIQGIAVEIK